jgi:hypothetical protein
MPFPNPQELPWFFRLMKEFKTISATAMKKHSIQHFKHLMTDMKHPSEMQPDLALV